MHFKLPLGIQQVQRVDVNVYQKIEIGYRSTSSDEDYEVVEKESKMITGDYNIVNVDSLLNTRYPTRSSICITQRNR